MWQSPLINKRWCRAGAAAAAGQSSCGFMALAARAAGPAPGDVDLAVQLLPIQRVPLDVQQLDVAQLGEVLQGGACCNRSQLGPGRVHSMLLWDLLLGLRLAPGLQQILIALFRRSIPAAPCTWLAVSNPCRQLSARRDPAACVAPDAICYSNAQSKQCTTAT